MLDGNVEKSICRAEKRDMKNSYNEYTEEEKSIIKECFKLYKEYSIIYKDRIITINRDEKNAFKKIVDVIEEEIRKEG